MEEQWQAKRTTEQRSPCYERLNGHERILEARKLQPQTDGLTSKKSAAPIS